MSCDDFPIDGSHDYPEERFDQITKLPVVVAVVANAVIDYCGDDGGGDDDDGGVCERIVTSAAVHSLPSSMVKSFFPPSSEMAKEKPSKNCLKDSNFKGSLPF